MRISTSKLTLAVTLLALPWSAARASVECVGTVSTLRMEPNGDLYAHYGYGTHRVCNINSSMAVDRGANGGATTITPAACQILYSQLITAKATGRQISIWIDRTNCNIGDFVVPNPYPYFWNFPQ